MTIDMIRIHRRVFKNGTFYYGFWRWWLLWSGNAQRPMWTNVDACNIFLAHCVGRQGTATVFGQSCMRNGYSSKFGCQCLCFFRMKSPSLGVGRSNPYPNYASSFVFQQDQDIQLYWPTISYPLEFVLDFNRNQAIGQNPATWYLSGANVRGSHTRTTS